MKHANVVTICACALAALGALLTAGCGRGEPEPGPQGRNEPAAPTDAPHEGHERAAPSADTLAPSPTAATPESIQRGAVVYDTYCKGCHGARGRGDGPSGQHLRPAPADLASPDAAGESDAELFQSISTGHGGMPAFERVLSADQRWDAVNYVRALQKETRAPGT